MPSIRRRYCQAFCENLTSAVTRKKKVDKDDLTTPLKRCLTVLDLTLLGIGNMTGSGIYVLTGVVARTIAGPAIVLSFSIAGITALLNALCYAELACRIPKAGSAYTYTYVAAGELTGFLVGWTVILEYILSVASIARALSGTIDSLTGKAISNWTIAALGEINILGGSPQYIDLVSAGIILLFCLITMTGVKSSMRINNTSTVINIVTALFLFILMLVHNQPSTYAPQNAGGFAPFGISGIIEGASTCFFAFIGFDVISICNEEAISPKTATPIANFVSVISVLLMLVGASFALTMFYPWYELTTEAPFVDAILARGIHWAFYIAGAGTMFGMANCLFSTLIGLPRVVYSMAQDGLLFKMFAYVYPKTNSPVVSIAIFGLISALLAALLSLESLADFLSIGTLISYTAVCIVLLVLRLSSPSEESGLHHAEKMEDTQRQPGELRRYFLKWPVIKLLDKPRRKLVPLVAMLLFVLFASCGSVLVFYGSNYLIAPRWWSIFLLVQFSVGLLLSGIVMSLFEMRRVTDTFELPFVPILPCLTLLINVILMVKLNWMNWIRFLIWSLTGILIYILYGVWHSNLRQTEDEKSLLIKTNGLSVDKNYTEEDIL